MNIVKSVYTNANGYVNLGRAFESEIIQIFPDFVKSLTDDDSNGIDGKMTYKGSPVTVQLKCALHSDGGADLKHGYSKAHKTTQRKLQNVDYVILALPEVLDYRRYTLNHALGVVYVVNRSQAIKRKLFAYDCKGEIYFPKVKRKILDIMIADGYADPVDIIKII